MLMLEPSYLARLSDMASRWIQLVDPKGARPQTHNFFTPADHRDALVLRGWRLSSRICNPTTSPWMRQLTWLRIVHCGDCCLHLALHIPSGAWQKRWRCDLTSNAFELVQRPTVLPISDRWWIPQVNLDPNKEVGLSQRFWGRLVP